MMQLKSLVKHATRSYTSSSSYFFRVVVSSPAYAFHMLLNLKYPYDTIALTLVNNTSFNETSPVKYR